MKTYIKTENGSLYVIHGDYMTKGSGEPLTWERIESTKDSGPLRTDGGDLCDFPEYDLGEPLIMLGPPIVDSAVGRVIVTSPIVSITYVLDEDMSPDEEMRFFESRVVEEITL